jgi:hypothetical protein
VVVVGLHDPRPETLGRLARHLAEVCRMPLDEMVEALQEGEVAVHAGLQRHEAQRAAHDLDAAGAAVDLRLTAASSGVFPILKPDAERRSGTAVGGFIDDSATPPSIADSKVAPLPLEPPSAEDDIGPIAPMRHGAAPPQLEPEPGLPVVTRRRTIGEAPVSMPPPQPPGGYPGFSSPPSPAPDSGEPFSALSSGLDRLTGGGDVDTLLGTLGEPDDHGRVAARPAQDRRTPQDGYRAPARPDAGSSERPFAPSVGAGPKSGAPSRANARTAEPEPPPPRRTPVPALAREPEPPPPRNVATKAASRKKDPFAAPDGAEDGSLQLDYRAAGLARPPMANVSHDPKPGQSGVLPRRTRAADTYGSGAAAHSAGSFEDRPLLGPERVSATFFGLAAGLAVGIFAAVLLQKGVQDENIVEYEAQMQAALVSPEKVAAGELRPGSAIEDDLAEAYDDIRRSFLFAWLAIGVPIGVVLGRLKRRS